MRLPPMKLRALRSSRARTLARTQRRNGIDRSSLPPPLPPSHRTDEPGRDVGLPPGLGAGRAPSPTRRARTGPKASVWLARGAGADTCSPAGWAHPSGAHCDAARRRRRRHDSRGRAPCAARSRAARRPPSAAAKAVIITPPAALPSRRPFLPGRGAAEKRPGGRARRRTARRRLAPTVTAGRMRRRAPRGPRS